MLYPSGKAIRDNLYLFVKKHLQAYRLTAQGCCIIELLCVDQVHKFSLATVRTTDRTCAAESDILSSGSSTDLKMAEL